ncbi:hypothetical protein B9Z19DRAFT_1065452 [Tuber borchii]|uniref:Kelch repeat protein n=1 Tax=Tuber borchii TaxID=42251 RepID=A0A2T6ZR16_TUBBO|nr:hypothetical protein B9Z19DRAFT_1065452 [Tuber borchii]
MACLRLLYWLGPDLVGDLGLFVLLLGRVVVEVPDPEKDLVLIANAQNDRLRRIDLTRPFTASKIDTVQEQSVPLSDEVPLMRSATMWAHDSTIYLGPGSIPLMRGIWTYDTANPDAGWTKFVGRSYDNMFNPVIEGSVTYLDGIAYVMGGTYREWDLPTSNKTHGGDTDLRGVGEVWLGSLLKQDLERGVAIVETSSLCENDMSIIRVYDIASSTWKIQRATTPSEFLPRGRYHFCAVAMSAQDHSSHQIYFYGGLYQGGGTGVRFTLDDVWVLTLPSFQFIRAGSGVEASRFSGTCAVISPQYLLAYRGSSWESNWLATRNALLALLDLTDLEWKTEYTPADTSSVYRVPQKVIEVIGGDETGNAMITTPVHGFDDEFLSAIFNFSDSKKPTSSSTSSSPSTSSALKNSLHYSSTPIYNLDNIALPT